MIKPSKRPLLSLHVASYNDYLLELVDEENLEVESLKLGTYLSEKKLEEVLKRYPDSHRSLHLMSYLSYQSGFPPDELDLAQRYTQLSKPSWVSAHIAFGCSQVGKIKLKRSPKAQEKCFADPNELLQVMVRNSHQLREALNRPVIFENVPNVGRSGEKNQIYRHIADPELISDFINQSGTGFLLDLAHAQVTAANFDPPLKVRQYLPQLPLHQVKEIHVSGPRVVNGKLLDRNEPLRTEDYQLLRWTLKRTQPEVITLEYWKNKNQLHRQITRLHQLLNE